ncbi:MAG: FMN-binding protein [Alkalispirochaeta sp.]|jgi:major membrane immunogen (membrane-anchored lipoprotein)
MKKLGAGFVLVLIAVLFVACSADQGEKTVAADAAGVDEAAGITVENAYYFTHVDGFKTENEMVAFVLFEYEQLKTVRYQVGYIACTCRGPEVNYYSVANVELNKSDASVVHISYDEDSTEHYTAGLYGDSPVAYDGTPVKELFDRFMDEEIRGKSAEEINAYEAMHGEVDVYTGATVTVNNAMRMLQGLISYHSERYINA